jgi:hypothetical protein
MSRLRWILLIVLILLILAFKFLPWYVLVGLAVALVVGAPLVGRWLLFRLLMTPFRAKGAVLRGATVTVRAFEPARGPTPAERRALAYERQDDEDEGFRNGEREESPIPRRYYRLVVTITPRPKVGGFQHWEPGELRLVLPWTRPMKADADGACKVEEVEIEENGVFQKDEGFKLHGEQTLRLRLGVRPGVERLVFQYYFEKFGDVILPEGGPA